MTDPSDKVDDPSHALYWKANIRILLFLVAVWFTASLGLGVLAVDWLDQFRFMGFPFGFWIAQQGSIVVFLIIIGVYAVMMNRLDKKHGVEEEEVDSKNFEI